MSRCYVPDNCGAKMAKALLLNATYYPNICLQRLRDSLAWRTLQDVQAMNPELCSSYMGMGRNATCATFT